MPPVALPSPSVALDNAPPVALRMPPVALDNDCPDGWALTNCCPALANENVRAAAIRRNPIPVVATAFEYFFLLLLFACVFITRRISGFELYNRYSHHTQKIIMDIRYVLTFHLY
jgi:hypothetical protein